MGSRKKSSADDAYSLKQPFNGKRIAIREDAVSVKKTGRPHVVTLLPRAVNLRYQLTDTLKKNSHTGPLPSSVARHGKIQTAYSHHCPRRKDEPPCFRTCPSAQSRLACAAFRSCGDTTARRAIQDTAEQKRAGHKPQSGHVQRLQRAPPAGTSATTAGGQLRRQRLPTKAAALAETPSIGPRLS